MHLVHVEVGRRARVPGGYRPVSPFVHLVEVLLLRLGVVVQGRAVVEGADHVEGLGRKAHVEVGRHVGGCRELDVEATWVLQRVEVVRGDLIARGWLGRKKRLCCDPVRSSPEVALLPLIHGLSGVFPPVQVVVQVELERLHVVGLGWRRLPPFHLSPHFLPLQAGHVAWVASPDLPTPIPSSVPCPPASAKVQKCSCTHKGPGTSTAPASWRVQKGALSGPSQLES